MNYKTDLGVCWKVSEIFELAANENYSPINFTKRWLCSDVSKRIYEKDKTLLDKDSQEIIRDLEKECGEYLYKSKIKKSFDFSDMMDWTGYIFSHMILIEKIQANEILNNYDIERIMNNYDILHTFSPQRAVEEIVSEYDLTKNYCYGEYDLDER